MRLLLKFVQLFRDHPLDLPILPTENRVNVLFLFPATSNNRQVALSYKLPGYRLLVTGYRLQVTSYKLQVTSYKLQVTSNK